MQDAIHCILKLRNRELNPNDEMPMGNKQVSAAHMKVLIREVPKLVHGLVYFDIYPDDRQNYKSMEKCMNERVRKALLDHVPDSEATVMYLQLCSEVAESLMDHDVIPHQRIEKNFHVVFFLRIWSKWISSSGYKSTNFITKNAYMCIETNAANLLNLVRRFREEGRPELFITTLFDSQACERAFRQFRAMGTPNFTKVNFTLHELLHMTRRYEVQNDIIYKKLTNIKLPKLETTKKTTNIYALPSELEIGECLNRAKRLAIEDALRFGIQIESAEIDECELNIPKQLINEEDRNEDVDEDDMELFENVHAESDSPDENDPEFYVNEESLQRGYLKVKDPTNPNNKISMRKSTFVWHLTDGTKRISSDRLIRVQNTSYEYVSERFKGDSTFSLNKVNDIQNVRIGDWCIFKNDTDDTKICIGLILALKFSQGTTAKEKRYKGDFVDLKEYKKRVRGKEVAALSSWYSFNTRGYLVPVKKENHHFIKVDNYIATVIKPNVDRDINALYFSENHFKEIERDVLKILNAE